MSSLIISSIEKDRLQDRLFSLAGIFLFLNSIILTLSQAVRYHSWQVSYRWEHWIGFAAWVICVFILQGQSKRYLPARDPLILPIVCLLVGWGNLVIWRLSTNFGIRQTIWMIIGLLIFIVIIRKPQILPLFRKYKYVWLASGLLLTAITFIFGTYPNGQGPNLWLGCCGVYFQPSEPLKIILIIFLAAFFADHSLSIRSGNLKIYIPTLIIFAVSISLLVAQRDLGTATIFVAIYSLLIYLVSGKRNVLFISALVLVIFAIGGYFLFDVIRIRFDAWYNPWIDPSGKSYQIVQSIIAVASGGVFGTGLGLGSPSLVPVALSDFIFAAISEEFGLIGSIGLILAYVVLISRGWMIAIQARNYYQRYLACGITLFLAVQTILIIGGNLRLLPLTGVTLPFISYGGSSLVTSLFAFGILALISNNDESTAQLYLEKPFEVIPGLINLGFAFLVLISMWWVIIRSQALTTRYDNPRLSIADQYVRRGSLLDRNNNAINVTSGQTGDLIREYAYPDLSATVGYINPVYGISGLESSYDSYLRGVQGYPSSQIWLSELIYTQPPEGLNVRLSLDLNLQKTVDSLLADHKGAAVILNAQTGEALVIASHPNIDQNQISTLSEDILNDPSAPLLNRATQGVYPLGTAYGPFLQAAVLAKNPLPSLPSQTGMLINGEIKGCLGSPSFPLTWGSAISNGCPKQIAALVETLSQPQINELINNLELDQAPSIPLPVAEASEIVSVNPEKMISGADGLLVSPMQVAKAASVFSTNGQIPAIQIGTAVLSPTEGWIIFPSGTSRPAFSQQTANTVAHSLAMEVLPAWKVLGRAGSGNSLVSWFIGGTLSDWTGTPLSIVVVIEEDNPTLVNQIGETILKSILQP